MLECLKVLHAFFNFPLLIFPADLPLKEMDILVFEINNKGVHVGVYIGNGFFKHLVVGKVVSTSLKPKWTKYLRDVWRPECER